MVNVQRLRSRPEQALTRLAEEENRFLASLGMTILVRCSECRGREAAWQQRQKKTLDSRLKMSGMTQGGNGRDSQRMSEHRQVGRVTALLRSSGDR